MKKKILSFIVVILIIGLTGCKLGTNKKKGDSFEVSLYKNSSARVDWNYKLSEEDIVDVKYTYDNSGCAPDAEGCGGQAIYTVTALKPGKVELIFECSNKGMCPMDKITYEITVNDDLSISETHNEINNEY